jgi:hypothetical protein
MAMSKGSALSLFAVALLAACHGDAVQAPVATVAPQTSAPVAVKQGPTPSDLTAGMVEAVTLGKSTVPVGLKFDLGGRPMVGQPLQVVFAVMPQVAASSATLQVTGGEGLQIGPDAGPVEIPSLDPTEVYRVSVTITPTADGVRLLGLNVTVKHDEAIEMRSFSVPIIVGTSADTAAATASTGKR